VICHTPTCPASHSTDEFGRAVSVEHGALTHSVLGATGHHLLNRHTRGELPAHLQTWDGPALDRAHADLTAEINRTTRYLAALIDTRYTVITHGADGVPAR
jgi:uncharacterized membrane protein